MVYLKLSGVHCPWILLTASYKPLSSQSMSVYQAVDMNWYIPLRASKTYLIWRRFITWAVDDTDGDGCSKYSRLMMSELFSLRVTRREDTHTKLFGKRRFFLAGLSLTWTAMGRERLSVPITTMTGSWFLNTTMPRIPMSRKPF